MSFFIFNQHLSLNIFMWCSLVSDSLSLNVTKLDETAASYFSVGILYSSIMSPLMPRYAKVSNFNFRKRSLYSMSLKPGIHLVALR